MASIPPTSGVELRELGIDLCNERPQLGRCGRDARGAGSRPGGLAAAALGRELIGVALHRRERRVVRVVGVHPRRGEIGLRAQFLV